MPSKLAEKPGADIAVGGLIYRQNAKVFGRHQRPEHGQSSQSSRRLLCRRVYRLAFEENMSNELAGHRCELGGPFLGMIRIDGNAKLQRVALKLIDAQQRPRRRRAERGLRS